MKRRGTRLIVSSALLVLLGSLQTARAEDSLGDASAAVQEVLATVAKNDKKALRELAERTPARIRDSAWAIVHELVLRGDRSAARAFARAPQRKDLAALDAYRTRIERVPPSRELWNMRLRALEFAGKDRWFELTKAVDSAALAQASNTVPCVELHLLLAHAQRELGQPELAFEHYRSATRQAMDMRYWRAVDMALHGWTNLAIRTQSTRTLLDCYELELESRVIRAQRVRAARAHANIASTLGNLGQISAARTRFGRVLEEYDDVIPLGDRVFVLAAVALAENELGHAAEAQVHALEAQSAARKAWKASSDEKQRSFMQQLDGWATEILGSISLNIRDYDEAERHFEEARDTFVRIRHSELQAEVAGNLGALALARGDLEDAREILGEARALYRRGGQESYVARVDRNLAEIRRREAQREKDPKKRVANLLSALRDLQLVLEIQTRLKDHPARGDTLVEMARVLLMLGKPARALAHLVDAQAQASANLDVQGEFSALTQMVKIHNARGDYDDALAAAYAAARRISFFFDRLPPAQASFARTATEEVYDQGLRAALAKGSMADAWYFLEGGRAGALLVSLEGRGRIEEAVIDPKLLREAQQARLDEALAEAEYQKTIVATQDRKVRGAAREARDAARTAREKTLQRIQLHQRIQADLLYPKPASHEDASKALASDEALVLYGQYTDAQGVPQLVALVVTKSAMRAVPVGTVEALRERCETLRYRWTAPAPKAAMAALRAQVVAPLALEAGVRRVLLSPVGPLAYQPPAVLFPEREVCCVASATSWMGVHAASATAAGVGVLALGDPVYGAPPPGWADSAAVAKRGGTLRRLPGSGVEARAVGDEHLIGPDATETQLLRRLQPAKGKPVKRRKAVHLACHGLVNERRPSYSGLAMTPSDEDDGLLTALEVYQARIEADLVVLSACDSGLGKQVSAEGIVGLTTAFLVAGARRVVASLWKVDDEASRALMIEFHRRWNAKDPKQRLSAPAALRAAQAYVRDYAKHHDGKHPEWSHPHYWAAWQIWGPTD